MLPWHTCDRDMPCGLCQLGTSAEARENEQLRAKINELEGKLKSMREDRDEYQALLHKANEDKAKMTSAASSAAATTVTAIERIELMEVVVKAAEGWADGKPHRELTEAVREWRRIKARWP